MRVNRVILTKEEPGPLMEEMLAKNGKRNEIYMTHVRDQTSRAGVYLGEIRRNKYSLVVMAVI